MKTLVCVKPLHFEYQEGLKPKLDIGLQKAEFSFSHPEFHKRESTLMSSRNATVEDFKHVISAMKKGLVNLFNYITHTVAFDQVKDNFESWLDPKNGVIKAMVSLE
ncbi:MAG TPA: hypothetical protein VF273_11550 [Pelobium sp.]